MRIAKGQSQWPCPYQLSGLRFLIRYRGYHYAFTRRFRIRRWQIHQLRQNARQFQAHFRTTDDHVDRAFLDQEFTVIQQEIAALNGSLQAEDYQRDFLGLDLFFKQARIRILYGYRKNYVKIKLRTLLKEYGYKRRSQNLVLHIQDCMEVYGLEATLRGGVPCNIAEVGLEAMLTFRVIENM